MVTFDQFCHRAPLLTCIVYNDRYGPACFSTPVFVVSGLGVSLSFFICVLALIMGFILLQKILSKPSNHGVKEMVFLFSLFVGRSLVEAICRIYMDLDYWGSFLGYTIAIYVGLNVSLYSFLMANGMLNLFLKRSCTKELLGTIVVTLAILLFVFIWITDASVDFIPGKQFNFGSNGEALIVFDIAFPIAFVVIFFVSQIILVHRDFNDRLSIYGYLFLMAITYLFTFGTLYSFNEEICKDSRYFDGNSIALILNMVFFLSFYVYWVSLNYWTVTEESFPYLVDESKPYGKHYYSNCSLYPKGKILNTFDIQNTLVEVEEETDINSMKSSHVEKEFDIPEIVISRCSSIDFYEDDILI